MPLELPNLDDRTYEDLVAEALSLVSTYDPDWTNHNPSDPGITLIELFAYLTEMLLYRLNQVTEANRVAFLRLIKGSDWQQAQNNTLDEEIRDTILKLRHSERVVTCQDFETAVQKNPQVARVLCIPRCHLEAEKQYHPQDSPGHVTVVIVPQTETTQTIPQHDLLDQVAKDLESRRLLMTSVHVLATYYVSIGVHFTLHLKSDALEKDVRPQAEEALTNFLHPLKGGTDGKGWQFGRNIYVSEIYQLLGQLPGVDYVKPIANKDELTVRQPGNPNQEDEDVVRRLPRDRQARLIAINIQRHELVALSKMIELKFEPFRS